MKRFLLLSIAMVALLAKAQNKPYITKVYDFMPAPGQFVNNTPEYNAGEPSDSIMARVSRAICGYTTITTDEIEMPDGSIITVNDTTITAKPGMISLGSFGGYVVFGFDHPVVNMHTWDFDILGNAFGSEIASSGGSSEPGIVMVGVDMDGDGVPSAGDRWYELAGCEYQHPKTQHDYSITYYRPDENKQRTPSQVDPTLNDTTYIRWTSNDMNPDSTSGYMSRNTFHNQPYWPLWLNDQETLSFTGAKLRCNAVDLGGNEGNAYYVQYFFDWGYVDNLPNNPARVSQEDGIYNPGFKIDWAVDDNGNHVNLTHIDFIKVYNAMNQYCGWMGETSTEVAAGIDFHPDAEMPQTIIGDVNGDGEVNISDVNALIDMILSGDSSPSGDVNCDGEVNIGDVNAVIHLILQ